MHWFGGIWGYLTVGLFAENPIPLTTTLGKTGLFMGKLIVNLCGKKIVKIMILQAVVHTSSSFNVSP